MVGGVRSEERAGDFDFALVIRRKIYTDIPGHDELYVRDAADRLGIEVAARIALDTDRTRQHEDDRMLDTVGFGILAVIRRTVFRRLRYSAVQRNDLGLIVKPDTFFIDRIY